MSGCFVSCESGEARPMRVRPPVQNTYTDPYEPFPRNFCTSKRRMSSRSLLLCCRLWFAMPNVAIASCVRRPCGQE